MLPHRCWNTSRNVRTVIERTDSGSLDQLIVTHLVKNVVWILWNPTVHYHNCYSLLVIPIHSQPNQAAHSDFICSSSTIYLMHMPKCSKWHICSVSLSQISYPFVIFPVYIALPNLPVTDMISGFCYAVNDIIVFWDFMQCKMVASYWRFGTFYRSHLQGSRSLKKMPEHLGMQLQREWCGW